MKSTHTAICIPVNLEPHPDADSLSICRIPDSVFKIIKETPSMCLTLFLKSDKARLNDVMSRLKKKSRNGRVVVWKLLTENNTSIFKDVKYVQNKWTNSDREAQSLGYDSSDKYGEVKKGIHVFLNQKDILQYRRWRGSNEKIVKFICDLADLVAVGTFKDYENAVFMRAKRIS